MGLACFKPMRVVVRGGGDLASGTIYRLSKAGFPVVVTELAHPLAIRRTVAYATAIYEGTITVEGVTARRIERADEIEPVWQAGEIPVLVDADGAWMEQIQPTIVVDARIAKRNLDTTRDDAPLVVALGPGFTAGDDCHAVIETNRGHSLGRVIWQGGAEPNTGSPGNIKGHTADRVLRAPMDGRVVGHAAIGDLVREGEIVAVVDDQPIRAPFDGMLRGLIHPAVQVRAGMKVGDVDPRGERDFCYTLSDKSLAIGGGVLEAVLSAPMLIPFWSV